LAKYMEQGSSREAERFSGIQKKKNPNVMKTEGSCPWWQEPTSCHCCQPKKCSFHLHIV